MKKNPLFILTFALLMACNPEQSFAEDNQSAEEKAFHEADIVNDGRIDTGELDMYHRLLFKRLDRDGDGSITLNECIGNCFSPHPGIDEAAPSGIIHYTFDDIDMDGSGKLVEYEYILYGREHFSDYDTNNDGFIDINEFCAFYDASMPCTFAAVDQTEESK